MLLFRESMHQLSQVLILHLVGYSLSLLELIRHWGIMKDLLISQYIFFYYKHLETFGNWNTMSQYSYWSGSWRLRIPWCALHWENYISISFHSKWDMIVVTVFEPNEISIWFKNCHHDHVPFTGKGNGNIDFSV